VTDPPISYMRYSGKAGSSGTLLGHTRPSASPPDYLPQSVALRGVTIKPTALWVVDLVHDFPISRRRPLSSAGQGA
jgi:hypothetical protein